MKTIYKYLLITMLILTYHSCDMCTSNNEQLENDTIYCIVIDKTKYEYYSSCENANITELETTVLNLSNNCNHIINSTDIYHHCNINDTIYLIKHYVPFEYEEYKYK